MAADNLLCNENILDVGATPAVPPAPGEPVDGDDDLFREVSLKYNGADQNGGDEEFVQYLAEKESSHGFGVSGGGQSVDFEEWVRRVRIKAIDWILNTSTSVGLRWKTAHLSVCYLDRFLTLFYIEPQWLWAMRLLQLACLSMAAKMEETNAAALSLSWYQVRGFNFGSEAIRRMEIHVMNNLGYRLNTPTPFDYIPCFIVKAVEVCPPREMVSRIVKLVFAFTKDVNLTTHRPSSIAIAAIMAGMDQKLEEPAVFAQMNTFAYAHLLDIGNVVECYNLMRNINVEDRGERSVIMSPDVSPGRFINDFVGEGSFSVCLSNGKRRRLDFYRPPDGPPDL